MSTPNIEYEICLTGRIKLSLLKKWKYLKNQKNYNVNYMSKYFDNDELFLLGNNLGLRLRYEGSHWVQTLKYEKLDHSRLEWNTNLQQTSIKEIPELNTLALPTMQMLNKNGCYLSKDIQVISSSLKAKFSVTSKRITWLIDYKGGVIEISYDTGYIETTTKKEKISEIELELIKGKPHLIWSLAKEIINSFPNLGFQYQSKAFRGFLLNGLRWEKFLTATNPKAHKQKIRPEQKLRELILKKNKTLSFFFSLFIKNYEEQTFKKISKTLTELRYIFQLLIIINKKQNKKNLALFINFKYQCSILDNKLKISNYLNLKPNKKRIYHHNYKKSFFHLIQKLIAAIGLFVNKTFPSLLNIDANRNINEYFLKYDKYIDRRKSLTKKYRILKENKVAYNLITYNSEFLSSFENLTSIIKKNKDLTREIEKLNIR